MSENDDSSSAEQLPATPLEILKKNYKGTALLISARIFEFLGTLLISGAWSDEDNAAEVSIVFTVHDVFSVMWGSILFGAIAEMAKKKGEILSPSKTPKPTIAVSIASVFFLSICLALICWPFYAYSEEIISTSIKNETLAGEASDSLNYFYDNGLLFVYLTYFAVLMVLSAFDYDVTLAGAQLSRLCYLGVAGEYQLDHDADSVVRREQFTEIFIIGYIIPVLIGIMGLCFIRSKADNRFYVAERFNWQDACSLRLFTKTIRSQVYLGLGPMTGIAPSLFMEYGMAVLIAPLINDNAIGAMRAFIGIRLIPLLAGNAVLVVVSRLAGQALGGVHRNTTDEQIDLLEQYIFNLVNAFVKLNLLMGVAATALACSLAPQIQERFSPDNPYLADRLLYLTLMLGVTFQIGNDAEEGCLNGLGLVKFKSILMPISFVGSTCLAWGFVYANGDMQGMFGGIGLGMMLTLTFLHAYIHDKTPCVGSNIKSFLFSAREAEGELEVPLSTTVLGLSYAVSVV